MQVRDKVKTIKGYEHGTPSAPDREEKYTIHSDGVYIDKSLWIAGKQKRRATDYVITLDVPCLPSAHFGAEGVHASKPMAEEHVDFAG